MLPPSAQRKARNIMSNDQLLHDGTPCVISVKSFGSVIKLAVIFLLTVSSLRAAIIEVSIPEGSQNPFCRPSYDSIWTVTTPPFPFNDQSGIGIIVKPAFVAANDDHDFAMHQNDAIQ